LANPDAPKTLPLSLAHPGVNFTRTQHDWIGANVRPEEELVAGFGGAEIIKTSDDRIEIRGGTDTWMKQFLI
jgi:hypothetical protein